MPAIKRIAIIGGSGLEDPDILKFPESVDVETPYGQPSSDFICGKIGQTDVAIISRHGRDHSIPPSQVNNRANIWAIHQLGCTHILATTACGSLRSVINRGHFVILDQFIDFTRQRKITFFEQFQHNDLKHTPMADPFNKELREKLIAAGNELHLPLHQHGTVITIEGPRFSTRAESRMYRIWGADVVNMSTAPECILANELGIPYATIAMATDYDCWKEDEIPVSWDDILKVFGQNIHNVINMLTKTIPTI
jgi:5'-methylthioadenosine phosphorylase